MKLYIYLLLLPILNFWLVSYIISFLLILFLLKIIFTKPIEPTLLSKPRNIHLTIIVPIFNESDNLKNLIDCFGNNQKKFDIVFIDDLSTDTSFKILIENQDRLNYHIHSRKEKRGFVAGVLNDGFNFLQKNINNGNDCIEYVGVINGDCRFDKNMIDKVLDKLEKYDIDVLNLSNTADNLSSISQQIGMLEKIFKNNLSKNVEVGLNNGYFLKKSSLIQVNQWSETELTEDLNLTLKLKEKKNKFFQSDLCVIDNIPSSLRILFNQKYRWIKGDITNRMKIKPKNFFDIIVNIYYLFPLFTLFSIFLSPYLLLKNIFFMQILIWFIEITIYFKFENYKNIFSAVKYTFTQFLFAIYFYLFYGLEKEDIW